MNRDNRFAPVSEEELNQTILDCFGSEAQLSSFSLVIGGVSNTSYLIELAGEEKRYIIRFAPVNKDQLFEFEKGMLAVEPILYKRMAEKGIPVPTIVRIDDSLRSVNREYSIVEYIEGCVDHAKLPPDSKSDMHVQLGKLTRALHTIQHTKFGWPMADGSVRGSNRWSDVLIEYTDEICRRNSSFGLVNDSILSRFRHYIQDNRGLFDGVVRPCLVHNDIWEPNILVKEEGGKCSIVALIDPERAIYADPEYEYALWWNNRSFMKGSGKELDGSKEGNKRRQAYKMINNFYMVYTWKVHSGDQVQCENSKSAGISALTELELQK
jgi:aminoglycoside phosphotransferase (APT) family kinase protein